MKLNQPVSIVLPLLLLFVTGVCGCGYSLAGRGDFLPDYIKVIGVPTFQNRSNQLEIEEIFTQKVVEEFNSRGSYVVRAARTGVDAVLIGTITAFDAGQGAGARR